MSRTTPSSFHKSKKIFQENLSAEDSEKEAHNSYVTSSSSMQPPADPPSVMDMVSFAEFYKEYQKRKRRRSSAADNDANPRASKRNKSKGGNAGENEAMKKIWSTGDFREKYKIRGKIGEGGGGIVYSAIRREDKKPVAIKRLKASKINKWGEVDGYTVPIEFEMLHKASQHPNVIEMVDWFQWKREYVLVMERPTPVMDIFKAVGSDGLPEMIARHVFRQVVEATLHCHKNGIIHRDIKDTNVLFNPQTLEAKLIDFGVSTRLKNEPHTRLAGTEDYYPPEWFTDDCYEGRDLDVWSLGTLLYVMVEGEEPFQDVESIIKCELHYKSGDRVSDACKHLIGSMLRKDPERRPAVQVILRHPWFSM